VPSQEATAELSEAVAENALITKDRGNCSAVFFVWIGRKYPLQCTKIKHPLDGPANTVIQ
jgi:hypothetical protein